MLSIKKMDPLRVLERKFLSENPGFYMSDQRREELCQWMGQGAEAQGLTGLVTTDQCKDIFNGELPSGTVRAKRWASGRFRDVPGYEFTFSMNLDLSSIAFFNEMHGLSHYFVDCHIKSVKVAMIEVEKLSSKFTFVEDEVLVTETSNLIIALCTHYYTSDGLPSIYTNAFVANATTGDDGEWATFTEKEIRFFNMMKDYSAYLEKVYKNTMAEYAGKKRFSIERNIDGRSFDIKVFSDQMKDLLLDRLLPDLFSY